MSAIDQDRIHRREYWLVAAWALVLVVLYGVGGFVGARAIGASRHETEALRQHSLENATIEPGGSPALPRDAALVHVGIYLNDLGEFSTKEGFWNADFDVWFLWTDPRIHPGDTFQVVNGEVSQREKIDDYTDGDERYERYRVKARLAKFFDPTRLPFGNVELDIVIEDAGRTVQSLRYVADDDVSGVGRFGILRRLVVVGPRSTVQVVRHESSRGDPRVQSGELPTRSRFVFTMLVAPPSWPMYLKNFQGLFAAVAVALIVFFIRPTYADPRFGLGVGAFFAAVTNNIMVADSLPTTDRITLTTMVNAIGLATIFLTLAASAISLYLDGRLGRTRLSDFFDRVSFSTLLFAYATLNVVLPCLARQ